MKTLKDINWNQVYCFYEVAKRLSMKEAGAVLGVSVPTISEQIRRLESSMDAVFFERQHRKMELTAEGATFYGFTKEIFEVGGRMLDALSPALIGGYTVQVGMQESISSAVAVNFLNRYWDLYAPYGTVNTTRELLYDGLIEKLHRGRYDWGITLEIPQSLKLNTAAISDFEVVYCCSHQVFNRFKSQEDILRNMPLARNSWDKILNSKIHADLLENGISPEEIIETDHVDFAITLAIRGRCVVPLAKRTVEHSELHTHLKTFSLKNPIRITIYAAWQKSHEKMISVKKLTELLGMDHKPMVMDDPEFQIKISEVPESLLKQDFEAKGFVSSLGD